MTDKFMYWMAVEESKPIQFSDLACLMAKAIYPFDDFAFAAAVLNFEEELPGVVHRGELVVRNPLNMGPHTYPHGHALKKAVMLPHDLRPFLETRSIELRLLPHGSGPMYWTLGNAAADLAQQENWHDEARGTLLDQMVEAANNRELTVRDPHTALPKTGGRVREFYELVTPLDLNQWLEKQVASYRWSPPPALQDEEDVHANASEKAQDASASAAVAGVKKHAIKTRSDPLAAVLEMAKNAAVDRHDYMSVWAALVNLAKSSARPAPILGYADLEGIKYEVAERDEPRFFTKDALRKRMNAKARGAA